MTQRLGPECEGARGGRGTVVEAEEAAWREVPRLGVQMGCRTPLRGVTPERRASLHLGRQSWGSDSREPHLQPRPELENIRPLLPGWLGSPEETSPWTPAEMSHGTALFLAGLGVGQTDRQRHSVAGCLVTG